MFSPLALNVVRAAVPTACQAAGTAMQTANDSRNTALCHAGDSLDKLSGSGVSDKTRNSALLVLPIVLWESCVSSESCFCDTQSKYAPHVTHLAPNDQRPTNYPINLTPLLQTERRPS